MPDGPDEHPQRHPVRYRLMTAPVWARGVVAGVFFGAAMFAYLRSQADTPGSLLFHVVAGLGAGVAFAVPMALIINAMERRLFDGEGAGPRLSREDRVRVLRAVDAGRWPEDAWLHSAAARVVDERLRRIQGTPFLATMFGFIFAFALYRALMTGWPVWWCIVAFWLLVGPWAVLITRRQRRAARALRLTSP